jgi:3-hydroxyisobutyrate dehydrogenase-like beta-hydroxyacid dehydrogenase
MPCAVDNGAEQPTWWETRMTKIAIIGFGEVGHIFACGLLANEGVEISVFDILFDDPDAGANWRADASAQGLRPAASAADAAKDARVVISAVTADAVAGVAEQAAGYLQPGQLFFDINSASPVTKKTAFGKVAPTGARYVEGAVMQPVPGPGLKVPILGGGPHAEEAAALLNPLGMNITPVSTEPGRASAMKLCRSIMIKGIEALIVDCAAAAKAWDVEKEVYGSLQETWPSIDFADLAGYMGQRVRQHGIRRAAEMREAAMMVGDIGRDDTLCRAVADAQERGAERKVKAPPAARAAE